MAAKNKKAAEQQVRYAQLFYALNSKYFTLYRYLKINRREAEILGLIKYAEEPITQTRLCELTGLPKQTVHSVIVQLDRKGAIVQEATDRDGRMRVVRLADDDPTGIEEKMQKMCEIETRAFASLPEKETERYLDTMEKLLQAMNREVQAFME